MDNAHKEFQKAIGAAVCRYVPERGVLLAISRHENIHRHSSMLQEMHFRNLSQKVICFYIRIKKGNVCKSVCRTRFYVILSLVYI